MGASTIYFLSTNGVVGAERSLKQWAFLRIDPSQLDSLCSVRRDELRPQRRR